MSTINIKYGKNYHLKRTDYCYEIEFNDENQTLMQEVFEDGVSRVLKISSFDERVLLCDGKHLVRLRDEVYVK